MSSFSRRYGSSVDVYPLLDHYSESLRVILDINERSGVIGIPVLTSLKLHITAIFGILDKLEQDVQFLRALVSGLNGLRRIMEEVVEILSEVQELSVVPDEGRFPLCCISLAILYYLSQTFQDLLELVEIPTEQEFKYGSLLSSVRDVIDVYPWVLEDFNVPFDPYVKFSDIIFFKTKLRETVVKTTTAGGVGFPNTKETYSPHPTHSLLMGSRNCEQKRRVPKERSKSQKFWGKIRSAADEYQFLEYVGKGSFGKVAKYLKIGTRETVALKVTRGTYSRNKTFENECKMCRRLNEEDTHNLFFARALDIFCIQDKGIIAFECLGPSLEQCLIEPFSLGSISVIAKQLFSALATLTQLRIIHTDIKPENIVFVDPVRQPFRIKIIDFGLAIDMEKDALRDSVQPLAYRAPEVLLGLPYSEAIDMWSVGCVLAELFLGDLLYPGYDEREQIQFICDMQGPPPDEMLNNSPKAEDFFYRERERGSASRWLLKKNSNCMNETAGSNEFKFKGFMDIFGMQRNGHLSFQTPRKTRARIIVRRRFADLLQELLSLNPDGRITPEEAMGHMFLYSFQYGIF